MEIRQLKAFVAVAKLHSFSRAAELLDYAQPSITAQVIHNLKDNKIDVAFFMGQGITNPDLVSETLLDEPMVLVSAAGHPLSKRVPVTPLDIQGETMILCGCCYRTTLKKIFEDRGLHVGSILK